MVHQTKNEEIHTTIFRSWKVRHLLRDGKAKVVSRCPFTIKLLYDSTNYTQNLILGVDTSSATIGTAVSDNTGKIVLKKVNKLQILQLIFYIVFSFLCSF